nr:DNA translocase FtsK [Lachnospiraceae bacterium]
PREVTSRSRRSVASSKIPDGVSINNDEVSGYKLPPVSILSAGKRQKNSSKKEQEETSRRLQETLANFGVNVNITNVSQGPTVTRYELQPEAGIKVSRIVSLTDDIKLALAAESIRIEAPIPGKSAIGIEVPNAESTPVMLRDLIESDEFRNSKSKISFAVGKDISGRPVIFDIAKMPHVLIAGATGAGKSVCINTIIMSILYKARPDEVKLMMIDPKIVELSIYNGIPHLLTNVVTDPQNAAGALNWSVIEMDRRYELFAEHAVRNLKGYNQWAEKNNEPLMPQIVIIVDELADLMMTAKSDVETAIVRLAQKARAAGMHLIIATQRPSVDVITGLIKANMPSRVAFTVTSGTDSRTILDMVGAERLLGKGDMLFHPVGAPKPSRVQGAFVSDEEVEAVAEFVRAQKKEDDGSEDIGEAIKANAASSGQGQSKSGSSQISGGADDEDEIFMQAAEFAVNLDKETVSIGLLQRKFRLGFNRAARIMDQLTDEGIVGEEMGTKGRKIVMTPEQFETFKEERA